MSKATGTHGLIVSPSGGFYGSEQVLLDFLKGTSNRYTVFVPRQGQLLTELRSAQLRHDLIPYGSSLPALYAGIAWRLWSQGAPVLYINEAGHVRYVKVLARLFPRRRFVVHVRINEDADASRWGDALPDNLRVVTISRFLHDKLGRPSELVHDPYPFADRSASSGSGDPAAWHVGIIGRITESKGIRHLLPLVEEMRSRGRKDIVFHLFGHLDPALEGDAELAALTASGSVIMEGFRSTRAELYGKLDAVLHLCPDEPLGRIFFEALDHGLPFVGFRSGGIGELGAMLDMTDLLVDPRSASLGADLLEKIDRTREQKGRWTELLMPYRRKATERFSLDRYVDRMGSILGN